MSRHNPGTQSAGVEGTNKLEYEYVDLPGVAYYV